MGNGTEKVFYRRGRNFYADGKLKPLAAKMRKSRKRRAEFLNRQLRQTRERGLGYFEPQKGRDPKLNFFTADGNDIFADGNGTEKVFYRGGRNFTQMGNRNF